MQDNMSILDWLARQHLIWNSNYCAKRSTAPFSLCSYLQGIDQFCLCYKATKLICDGSFFARIHLNLT